MVAILISKPRLLMELSIEKLINSSNLCGAPEGFELLTPRFVVWCSRARSGHHSNQSLPSVTGVASSVCHSDGRELLRRLNEVLENDLSELSL